jgi:HlyD family secretion protein
MRRTLSKFILPCLALGLLIFAIMHVVRAQQPVKKSVPPVAPPRTPFAATVAGAGIVEAESENISIGSHLPGVVAEVQVRVGAKVDKGTPLFRLDDRAMRANLRVMESNLAAARAEVQRLDSMPRPEELPAAEAKVFEAQASLSEQKSHYERVKRLDTERATTEQELVRRKQAVEMADQQVAAAKASYDLLKAGAWEPEKAVARAKVEQAQASLEQVQTEIDRLTVLAPVDGEVLQVNVRPGEYVGAPPGQALIVLGNVQMLHVRVDIDEHDIPRFRPGAPAQATLRGDPRTKFELTFDRVEPYVVPKKSLTGDNTERVDTRVLQVIYSLGPHACTLYVGQQLDAFIDAATSATETPAARAPATEK